MYRSSPPTLSCPQCAVALGRVEAEGGVALFTCATCGGAWIEADASLAVLQGKADPSAVQRASKPPAPKGNVAETPRPCARCGETMLPYPLGDVILDTCPSHGTWFDHDEIERVVKAARKLQSQNDGTSIELPSGKDVWATATFGLGMIMVPFEVIGNVLVVLLQGMTRTDDD